MYQNLQATVLRLWRGLSWTQRLSFIGLLGAVVGVVAVVAMWAGTPTYGVLFSNLSNQDSAAILTALNGTKIPYQLANGGATIMVPQDQVDKTRIQLAGQNLLPEGGTVGFESLANQSVFQSDPATQQVLYTRALEGELTRTIDQVQGVSYSRVNIVVPQQQLFSQDQANPTASVLVKTLPGATLSSDSISGIQHLVASAVQNLKPADVTVVDGSGTILSANSVMGAAGITGLTVLAAESRYASNLQAQLTAMLDSVLGPDKAVVRVNDAMDFTQKDSTSNTYDPQNGRTAVSESHIVTNTALGPTSFVGGVPGLASNVPNYGTSTKTTGAVTQTQQSADLVYAHSNTISHITQAPGAVTHLSIAVLLDNVVTPTVQQQLASAVAAAAGISRSRGDQLTLSSVVFDHSADKAAATDAAATTQRAFVLSVVRWAALLVVPLLLLFLLRRTLIPARAEDDEDFEDVPTVEEIEPEIPLLNPVGRPTIQQQQRAALQKSMAELAREKPETVAGVIGRWIEEDGG